MFQKRCVYMEAEGLMSAWRLTCRSDGGQLAALAWCRAQYRFVSPNAAHLLAASLPINALIADKLKITQFQRRNQSASQ